MSDCFDDFEKDMIAYQEEYLRGVGYEEGYQEGMGLQKALS